MHKAFENVGDRSKLAEIGDQISNLQDSFNSLNTSHYQFITDFEKTGGNPALIQQKEAIVQL